ncbi:hypothetical protein RRG08_040081 [Elysia crispata]|uniref:Uncharacterized protein n=1 Tax=Elysia crispata TaxID=231223 RepID=A0AAE1CNN1_9GAST|nr:hypothetical protein RRG08_040081 [Elysia crispata]
MKKLNPRSIMHQCGNITNSSKISGYRIHHFVGDQRHTLALLLSVSSKDLEAKLDKICSSASIGLEDGCALPQSPSVGYMRIHGHQINEIKRKSSRGSLEFRSMVPNNQQWLATLDVFRRILESQF